MDKLGRIKDIVMDFCGDNYTDEEIKNGMMDCTMNELVEDFIMMNKKMIEIKNIVGGKSDAEE